MMPRNRKVDIPGVDYYVEEKFPKVITDVVDGWLKLYFNEKDKNVKWQITVHTQEHNLHRKFFTMSFEDESTARALYHTCCFMFNNRELFKMHSVLLSEIKAVDKYNELPSRTN